MTTEVRAGEAIAKLLSRRGLGGAISITRLEAGGNNRIYVVTTSGGRFVAKHYFRNPADKRDRLLAEFSFLRYAERVAPGWTPAALVSDTETGWALYEYIDGDRFRAGEVTSDDVNQAAAFFRTLNRGDAAHRALRRELQPASEAGFSLAEHITTTDRRVQRVVEAAGSATTSDRFQRISTALSDCWTHIRQDVLSSAHVAGVDDSQVLPSAQRCISPSDFGFHNALRRDDGGITFVDFEYAGWDDPAKMAADVFCQIAVPVPNEFFEMFLENAFRALPGNEDARWRTRLLRPVMQVRWVCISVNVFLPEHRNRRQFADPGAAGAVVQELQMDKAEELLARLQGFDHGIR